MAAQSPVAETSPDDQDAYLLSWAAITQMLGQGFSLSGRERNSCFLNVGNGRFADASAVSGFDFLDDGRALGLVDWDFDGSLDVWALNRNGPQLRFLHNRLKGDNSFVSLRLVGTNCNRDAIGARIEIELGGDGPVTLIRTLGAGASFLSQSSKWVHFGLGQAETIKRLTVRWPGGKAEIFENLASNRQYVLTEGSQDAEIWTPPADRIELEPRDPEPPAITDVARVVLAARPVVPEFKFETIDGNQASVDDFSGSPVLVNLWATWCQPCLVELGQFSKESKALNEANLNILALNVDELGEGGEEARRSTAARVLQTMKYPFDAGTAGEDALAGLDALQVTNLGMQIPISLPTSFLLDSDGLVAVIYKGPVEVDQLLEDVRLLESAPIERRDQAAPFPGKWLAPANGTEPIRVALKMVDNGDRTAGLEYLKRYLERHESGRIPEASASGDLLQTPLSEVHFAMARLYRQGGQRGEAVASYRKILEIDPNHRKALLDLGHLFLRSGQPGMAAPYLAKVVAGSPGDIDSMSLLATAKLQLGKLEETEDLCHRILQKDPDHATAYLNLGLAAEGKKDFAAAVRHYRGALNLLPGWDIALNQLAWILATASDDKLRNGPEALNLALQLNQITQGRQAVFLRSLAAAQAENGHFEEAVSTIDRALSITPTGKRGLRKNLQDLKSQFANGEPYRISTP